MLVTCLHNPHPAFMVLTHTGTPRRCTNKPNPALHRPSPASIPCPISPVPVSPCRTAWQDGRTGLSPVSQYGHLDMVRLLLDSKADANLADKVHLSPERSRSSAVVACCCQT
jgi:hypothetical protein